MDIGKIIQPIIDNGSKLVSKTASNVANITTKIIEGGSEKLMSSLDGLATNGKLQLQKSDFAPKIDILQKLPELKAFKNFDESFIKGLETLTEKQYISLVQLLKKNEYSDFSVVIKAAKELGQEKLKIFESLDERCQTNSFQFIKNLNRKQIEMYRECLSFNDGDANEAFAVIQDMKLFTKYKQAYQNGCDVWSIGVAKLDDNQFDDCMKYLKLGEEVEDAIDYSKLGLTSEQFNDFKSALQRHTEKSSALKEVLLSVRSNDICEKLTLEEIVKLSRLNDEEYSKLLAFRSRGYDLSSALKLLNNDLGNKICTTNGELKIQQLEHGLGEEIELTRTKNGNSITKRMDSEGRIHICREEKKDGVFTSWNKDGNRVVMTEPTTTKNMFGYEIPTGVQSQIEIINDSTGHPAQILFSKQSENMDGIYDRTIYNLKDYPEDCDVIKMIQDGTIQGGKKISGTTKNQDGSITYFENLNTDGVNTKRNYTKFETPNGSTKYEYIITDENGNKILERNIAFERNGNTSTTIIDGKKYVAVFDDNTQTIKLTGDNVDITIDILSKTQGDKRLFEACKNLNANSLMTIDKNVDFWILSPNVKSQYNSSGKILSSSDNPAIIEHELGHSKDFSRITNISISNFDVDSEAIFSNNSELVEIYKKEFESFRNKYSQNTGLGFIDYFAPYTTPTVLGQQRAANGITEVFAETNMLLNLPCCDEKLITTRTQLLLQNFPKTIAYISKMINSNIM